MKQIVLKKLILDNFKGHKHFEFEFGADRTKISGDNATGKSTLFDAFVWLLFGKDQFGRKDFEIIPVIGGERLDKVDSAVGVTIIVDGRSFELRRVLHQKWVRKRGTSEEVFDGCETLYWVNDVPKKAKEYATVVDMICDETIFSLITNPSAFLGLHWQKQREFLFSMAGTVSDIEIASQNPEMAKLLEMVNEKGLVEYRKELSARKKKLKDELETIQPKIDQTVRLTPESQDFEALEFELSEVEKKISVVDLAIQGKTEAYRQMYDSVQGKYRAINDLKIEQNSLVSRFRSSQNEKDKLAQAERFKIESSIQARENTISVLQNRIVNTKAARDSSSNKIREKEITLEDMRAGYALESQKEYAAGDGCLMCPIANTVCNETKANEIHQQSKDAAKEAFNAQKQKTLDSIVIRANKLKDEIEAEKNKIKQQNDTINISEGEITILEDEILQLNNKLKLTPEIVHNEIDPNTVPGWLDMQKQIEGIQSTIEDVKAVDVTDLTNNKFDLVEKRDSLKQQLNTKAVIENCQKEVKRLSKEANDLAQQIADIEKVEFTMAEFNRIKIEECDRRINGLFQIVKFKLFDKTNEGNEFEACIPTNKQGVPISDTNTAEKINAGLDIINVLSNFYNVSAPIFIDGAESVNRIFSTQGQQIHLIVSKSKVLEFSI